MPIKWKRIWYFIWKDNSLLSWIVNIILAFLIVKFLIYPGLGLILRTDYPVVAVVSNSMEHDHLKLDEWWDKNKEWYIKNGFTKEEFISFPFHNGFSKGDIMVLYGSNSIKKGDIMVYSTPKYRYPIIHRLVGLDPYSTKGDHNSMVDGEVITEEKIVGKAVFRIPFLGWVKIWFTDLINLLRGGL
jgi:signal peptidase I